MGQDVIDSLLGKRIAAIEVSDGEGYLRFQTDAGEVVWEAEGDCCSESWFADIIGTSALIGGTVSEVVELEMPKPVDDRTRQEEDEAYGFRISTEKGSATIAFRNSSNGYYGGSLNVVGGAPEDRVFRSLSADDWSA